MSRNSIVCLGMFLALACSVPVRATTLNVSMDTSALSGTAASLALDLIDGDSALGNNTAVISAFSSDAALGSSSPTGGVSGSPPNVILSDTSSFNELLQFLTLGNSISFTLTLSDNLDPGGSFPDQFAVYLLDGAGLNPLVTTDQPVGADALFTYDMTGGSSGDLQVYGASGTGPTPTWSAAVAASTSVPEPSTLGLIGVGVGIGWRRAAKALSAR